MIVKKSKKTKKLNKEISLFITSTVIDEYEFKKFHKFYLNKFKSSLIPKIILIVLAMLAISINLVKGNYYLVILLSIFVVLYPVILSFTLNRQIMKRYEGSKRINMLEEKISFYSSFFESKSSINYCKVNYEDIYLVCETKENFYIFLNENKAFIVIKNNINSLDKFKEFIIEKAKYRRYR